MWRMDSLGCQVTQTVPTGIGRISLWRGLGNFTIGLGSDLSLRRLLQVTTCIAGIRVHWAFPALRETCSFAQRNRVRARLEMVDKSSPTSDNTARFLGVKKARKMKAGLAHLSLGLKFDFIRQAQLGYIRSARKNVPSVSVSPIKYSTEVTGDSK